MHVLLTYLLTCLLTLSANLIVCSVLVSLYLLPVRILESTNQATLFHYSTPMESRKNLRRLSETVAAIYGSHFLNVRQQRCCFILEKIYLQTMASAYILLKRK